MDTEFTFGRYYAGDSTAPVTYTSPQFDLQEEVDENIVSATLFSVSWTAYFPKDPGGDYRPDNRRFNDHLSAVSSNNFTESKARVVLDPNNAAHTLDPMVTQYNAWEKPWAPISVNIMDPSTGNWYYPFQSGTQWSTDQWPHFAGGHKDDLWGTDPVTWFKGDKFRFMVQFNLKDDETYLAVPILDDITFVFTSNKAKIFLWETE